jgi:hypothetical protein
VFSTNQIILAYRFFLTVDIDSREFMASQATAVSASSSSSSADTDLECFCQELLDQHSLQCQKTEAAEALRDKSSDTEESMSFPMYPTWWSKLIQQHTSHLKPPKVSAERPVVLMSGCSGVCPELAVCEAACMHTIATTTNDYHVEILH